MFKVTDITLTRGGLDKPAHIFASPDSLLNPKNGSELFKEDAHAFGRILLLMMQVGGTHKLTASNIVARLGTSDKNLKHIYEKKTTSWVELIEPYQAFSINPSKDQYERLILPILE